MKIGRAKIATMWASRTTWIDDSAKSKIDGRVAVANRTCPTVIVSVGTPYSHRSIKVLPVRNGTSWVGKKGPAEETSTYVTLMWGGIPQAREFGTCARDRSVQNSMIEFVCTCTCDSWSGPLIIFIYIKSRRPHLSIVLIVSIRKKLRDSNSVDKWKDTRALLLLAILLCDII